MYLDQPAVFHVQCNIIIYLIGIHCLYGGDHNIQKKKKLSMAYLFLRQRMLKITNRMAATNPTNTSIPMVISPPIGIKITLRK